MNATEIVISEVQSNRGFQVRQLLAERIRKPHESAHLHSHGEVLPLHKRCADLIRIGIASADLGYNLRDSWWGVPRIGAVMLSEIPKQFHELREVNVQTKGRRNRIGVVGQTVGGDLRSLIPEPHL